MNVPTFSDQHLFLFFCVNNYLNHISPSLGMSGIFAQCVTDDP
jgi:hypothetical protein